MFCDGSRCYTFEILQKEKSESNKNVRAVHSKNKTKVNPN